MSERDTDKPRLRIRRWGLLAFAVGIVVEVAAFVFTPVPGALVVRRVFDRDARRQTKELAAHAPRTDLVADIPYRPGDRDAFLDVYTPPGTTGALPTIVWTHGGAWLSGHRTNYAGYYRRLASAGFTVVSLGYSLAPGRRYPTPVQQSAAAHAFLLEHAEELHIDPGRIVLAGDSAGAQLTAQMALAITDADYASAIGIDPPLDAQQVRGVVLDCGLYDVAALEGGQGLIGWGIEQAMWAYTGARNYAASEAARQMSVLHSVTENFPATCITGGNGDPLTATQSRRLAQKLVGLGVDVDLIFYPDDYEPELGHEYQFDLSTVAARAALDRTIDFVRKVTT
ncbi:alpha/beta hydrolase [Rhodococcus sp. CH91]|uniref:alpha/beta hydrolase n=1 Tax=Rhodococcus sp. CH91 TaxID=2910256 RepID=UPI001F4AB3E6|nr:alpha/beta hydrolase [Rhodococcus sp. CH91]